MDRIYPEIPDYIRKLMESGDEWDEISINAEGKWFHNGVQFKNTRLIAFFNKSIDITRDREYVIHYSNFVYPILVEDAPLFVTGLRFHKIQNKETIIITLTSGDVEKLNLKTLFYRNNALYCHVRNGEILAKFKRSPSFELLQNIKETSDIYYLEICEERIILAEKV